MGREVAFLMCDNLFESITKDSIHILEFVEPCYLFSPALYVLCSMDYVKLHSFSFHYLE